jgi:hypothetical protein
VEHREGKGYRLCFRTENPKTGILNAVKKGTYHRLGGELFLDEKDHVAMYSLNEYSEPKDFREFLAHWPANQEIQAFLLGKKVLYNAVLKSGKQMFTINGVETPLTEADKERYTKETIEWDSLWESVKPGVP